MNNPLEFLKMIKNPEQYVMNISQQNANPILNNLIQMAQKGDTQGIENFARNIFKEQGQNYDEIIELLKK